MFRVGLFEEQLDAIDELRLLNGRTITDGEYGTIVDPFHTQVLIGEKTHAVALNR